MAPLFDDNSGWIKLHRQLLNKAIWNCSTIEQKVILITILLLANHEESQWQWNGKKFICRPGQFITSLPSLAKASGCSIQNIRTALKRFKKYEFLTEQVTGTGRLITVINWGKYQAKPEDLTGEVTEGQQTPNRPLTPNKKNKNDKKIYTPESQPYILAEYLLKKIRENNSNYKQPNIQNWALIMDRLIRLDNRQPGEVKTIIDFSQEDEFWKINILSPDKLRKQYDQLKIRHKQFIEKDHKQQHKNGSVVPMGREVPPEWN